MAAFLKETVKASLKNCHISVFIYWKAQKSRLNNGVHYLRCYLGKKKKIKVYSVAKLCFCCQKWSRKNLFITKTCINEQLERKYVSTLNHSSLCQALLRSSWNLARRLRWSEGNMWLGRPFIDHKTSSDRRERDPMSFRPSFRKLAQAREKKQ